jgi:hypothetical protein
MDWRGLEWTPDQHVFSTLSGLELGLRNLPVNTEQLSKFRKGTPIE